MNIRKNSIPRPAMAIWILLAAATCCCFAMDGGELPMSAVKEKITETFIPFSSRKTSPGLIFAVPPRFGYKLTESESDMVRVRVPEEFPAVIRPGQRIAVILPPRQQAETLSLKLKLNYVSRHANYWEEEGTIGGIVLRFNDKALAQSLILTSGTLSFIIPPSWHEPGGNLLEFIHSSDETANKIAFESITLKVFIPYREKFDDATAQKSPATMISYVARQTLNDLDGYATRKIGDIMYKTALIICRWASKDLRLQPVLDQVKFHPGLFDPMSGEPTPGLKALVKLAPLLDGDPEAVPSNLLPANASQFSPPSALKWASMINAPGVYSALIADAAIIGEWRFMLFVDEGDVGKTFTTRLERAGRDGRALEVIESTATAVDGYIDLDFESAPLAMVRAVAQGAKEPPPQNLPRAMENFRGRVQGFRRGLLKVSQKREPPGQMRLERQSIPDWPPPVINTDFHSVAVVKATPGEIDGAKNVVPWNDESFLVEIGYPPGTRRASGGVHFGIGTQRNIPNEFGMWVLPRSADPRFKTIPLRALLIGGNIFEAMEVNLPANQWSRLSLPTADFRVERGYFENVSFRLVGNPTAPEYARGNKISFEINSVHRLSTQSGDDSRGDFIKYSGVVSHRVADSKTPDGARFVDIILLVKPNHLFQFRHAFDQPIEPAGVVELSGHREIYYNWGSADYPQFRAYPIQCSYKRNAQLFVVKADDEPPGGWNQGWDNDIEEFPEAPPAVPISAAAMETLTQSERRQVEEDGLLPLVFRISLKP